MGLDSERRRMPQVRTLVLFSRAAVTLHVRSLLGLWDVGGDSALLGNHDFQCGHCVRLLEKLRMFVVRLRLVSGGELQTAAALEAAAQGGEVG